MFAMSEKLFSILKELLGELALMHKSGPFILIKIQFLAKVNVLYYIRAYFVKKRFYAPPIKL